MARHTYQLSVGKLVSTSIGIYFRNLVPFLLLAAVALSPWIALVLWIPTARLDGQQDLLVAVAAVLLQSFLTFLLTGALTYGVVMQLRGEPAGIGASVSQGFRSFFAMMGTGFICGARIFLWSLLCYIPGIVETTKLYVALPVAVMEGESGNAAARRSVALTDGSRWQIFGAWFLVAIGMLVIVVVLHMVVLGADGGFDESNPWLDIGVGVPMQAFGATMMAVAYFQLRMGKENIDVKQIAAVFD